MCRHDSAYSARPSRAVDTEVLPALGMPQLGMSILFTNDKGRQHVGTVIAVSGDTNKLAAFVMPPSGRTYTRVEIPWAGAAEDVPRHELKTADDFTDIPEETVEDKRFKSGYRVICEGLTAQEQADRHNSRVDDLVKLTGVWDFIS